MVPFDERDLCVCSLSPPERGLLVSLAEIADKHGSV